LVKIGQSPRSKLTLSPNTMTQEQRDADEQLRRMRHEGAGAELTYAMHRFSPHSVLVYTMSLLPRDGEVVGRFHMLCEFTRWPGGSATGKGGEKI
jgi:hypothetical protein